MKKVLFLSIILLSLSAYLFADPAKEGVFKAKQPNGVEIKLILNGDERVSYTTTEDGYLVQQNKKGYYCYVKISNDTTMVRMSQKVGISRRPSLASKPTDALMIKLHDNASKRWQQ